MATRPVTEYRLALKWLYRPLNSHIHTQMQIELLNNRATQIYLNYNNQLITPRKAGIAGNERTPTHPRQRHPPLSSSTESAYHQLFYTHQHVHSTHTCCHVEIQHKSRVGTPRLHKCTNLNSNISTWSGQHLSHFPLPVSPELPGSVSATPVPPPLPTRLLPRGGDSDCLSILRDGFRVGGRGRIWEGMSQPMAKGCGAVGGPGLEGFFKKEEGRG